MVTVTHPDIALIGHHCSFGATTDISRPYKWHWMRDGVLIAGAPSARAYTTLPLPASWFGSKFSVRVYGLDGEVETSNEVELQHPNPKPAPEPVPEPEPKLETAEGEI